MFKVGREIHIEAPRFRNNCAVLVAPAFNIHGLQLSATRPIPSDITFLKSKGASVEVIEEDGDVLLRISGNFSLARETVVNFLGRPYIPSYTPRPHKYDCTFDCLSWSHEGDLEYPSLMICGLGLIARKGIPAEVVAFLKSKGAKTVEVIEKGDKKLVRLSGKIVLTKTEVTKFLEERAAVSAKESLDRKPALPSDLKITHDIVEARNFQRQVQTRLKIQNFPLFLSGHPIGLKYTFKCKLGDLASTSPSHIYSSNRQDIVSGEGFSLSGSAVHANTYIDISCGTGVIEGSGEMLNKHAGYLSDLTAGKELKIQSEQNIEFTDALVLVGEDFKAIAEEGEISMSFDPKKAWINMPPIPSLVFSDFVPLSPRARTRHLASSPASGPAPAQPAPATSAIGPGPGPR